MALSIVQAAYRSNCYLQNKNISTGLCLACINYWQWSRGLHRNFSLVTLFKVSQTTVRPSFGHILKKSTRTWLPYLSRRSLCQDVLRDIEGLKGIVGLYGFQRLFSSQSGQRGSWRHTKSALTYIVAAAVFMVGATYAGVPLYRMLCQSTGLGGEIQKGHDSSKVESMRPVKERVISIRFNADTASNMQWNFRPHQSEIKVLPGETALAFYKAKNPTDQPVIGISTYNVVPFEACFCFEEQRLNPHEEVDLPVFFYIDPEFCDDPKLERVNMITLLYTFFEANEGMTLPVFKYAQSRHL